MKANPIAGYMVKTARGMLIARTLRLTEKECADNYAWPETWTRYVKEGYRCVPVIIEEKGDE